MRFNANRLATLAGIPTSSNRRSLNEAGNQSRRDEGFDDGYDWYSKDLNEGDGMGEEDPVFPEDSEAEALADIDAMAELPPEGEDEWADPDLAESEVGDEVEDLALEFDMGPIDGMSDEELELMDEELVEINETMLRREISRMRRERAHRANSRSVQLQEERHLRNAIKSEIGSILGELGERRDLYTTRHWLYGDRKPRNSKHGYVARGGFGIGFE